MILLLITLLIALCTEIHGQDSTYLLTAPQKWRLGAQETVIIQAFAIQGDIPVKLSLWSPFKKKLYSQQTVNLQADNNYQALAKLQVLPNNLISKAEKAVILEAQSSLFTRELEVPLLYENGFLFIQTDKGVYTPDQSVNIRVYSMNEELRPANRPVKLTIKDPKGVTMDELWKDDLTGVISFPAFKIPASPSFGLWTINAAYSADFSTTGITSFEVKEYTLPRFSVFIIPSRNYISYDTFTKFQITVEAKYYYGKKVDRGKAFIRFGIIRDGKRTMMPKSLSLTPIINGKGIYYFNSEKTFKELQDNSLEALEGARLYIAATVEEEEGAQSEESESSNVKYILSPYQLSLIATPLFVKPSLPYHMKVEVKDTLDKPVPNLPLAFTAKFIKENQNVNIDFNGGRPIRQTTGSDGTTMFVLTMLPDIVGLEFTIKTEDKELQEDSQAMKTFKATSYNSLTKSYLYINWAQGGQKLNVGGYLDVSIFPNTRNLHKLTHYSYLVVSRGKIVQHNTVKRVFGSVSQNLNIQIMPNMVPSFRLVVYYIVTQEGTAELIADSIWVEVQEKCVNNQKVQLTAPDQIYSPKEEVMLTMNAQAGSILALSAVDVSIYDVTKKSQRPLERVLRKLDESDLGCGAGAGWDNKDVLERAGLTFLTNANVKASGSRERKCEEKLRSRRSLEDEIRQEASKLQDEKLRRCCLDGGLNLIRENECEAGTKRVQRLRPKFPQCAQTFQQCCRLAQQLKAKSDAEQKDNVLSRMYVETVFDLETPEIRSYFPESWLWEEHYIKDSGIKQKTITLPDSLTTWELQGVGMSDKGICVADPLKLTVFKDLFLDVQFPYSVKRGEQVEIKVAVYNYRSSKVMGCVKASAEKKVCLVSEIPARARCADEFLPNVPKTYTFNLLPLEIGEHEIHFEIPLKETVKKKLRVVAEGVPDDKNVAFVLDPQGVRGRTRNNEKLPFVVPPNVVPKSTNRILFINGKVLGEVIKVVLSGEKLNMLASSSSTSASGSLIVMAPMFYVYRYLEAKNEWALLKGTLTREDMRRKLHEGVVSLLSFRNRDYSYSLTRNEEPSVWVSAFVVRMFSDLKLPYLHYLGLCNSLMWLIRSCQLNDGSFREKSSALPFNLPGSVSRQEDEKRLFMTAYVMITLGKAQHQCPNVGAAESLKRATDYLSSKALDAQSTLGLAVSAYALHMSPAKSKSTHDVLSKLKDQAYYDQSQGSRFWSDTKKLGDASKPTEESAMMVLTTAYALLAVLKAGDIAYANPIVSWLTTEQRYGGGFFGLQDTLIALEALTEFAILEQKLTLDMEVMVDKASGPFKSYYLEENEAFVKPIEVPDQDDLTIRTGGGSGITTGKVRTVFNRISPLQKNCNFDFKIQKRQLPKDQSIFSGETSSGFYMDACAKYKPQASGDDISGPAVMEISLLTGLVVDDRNLKELMNRVDMYVTDSKFEDGKVILHLKWIESTEFICVNLLLRKIFHVSRPSPGVFKVYEENTPENHCITYFNPFREESLVKACTGKACQCLEGECPKLIKPDTKIKDRQRKDKACHSDATFAYKVQIIQSKEDGDFKKYTASIADVFNKGTAKIKKNDQIQLIKKRTCSSMDLESGKQYLVMGRDGIEIQTNAGYQYEYPLDSNSWVELWPDSSCGSECEQLASVLEDFSEEILLYGCH